MKKSLAAGLLAVLLLTGCTAAPESAAPVPPETESITVAPTETRAPETLAPETVPAETPPAETRPELSPEAYQVVYNYMQEENQEYYIFQGLGPDKDLVWTLETRHLDCAETPRVCPIGTMDGKFFYCEDGSVLALDVITGAQLWENPDFGGTLVDTSAAILDPSGFLYLCSYSGPDLFVLDTAGNTVKKIDHFDPNFYWASRIWQEDRRIWVHLEGGSPEGVDFSAAMDWLPQAQG